MAHSSRPARATRHGDPRSTPSDRHALRDEQRHGRREETMRRIVVPARDRGLLGVDLAGDSVEARLERLDVALDLLDVSGVELQARDELKLRALVAEGLASDGLSQLGECGPDMLLLLLGAAREGRRE